MESGTLEMVFGKQKIINKKILLFIIFKFVIFVKLLIIVLERRFYENKKT